MKKKIIGIVYLMIVLCIVGALALVMSQKDDMSPNIGNNTGNNNAQKESSEMTEEEKEVNKGSVKILEEISKAERNSLIHRGEYPGRADSRELNSEFINDGCILSDPVDGYEIEFLTYEELPDLTEYINKEGIIEDVYDTFKERVGALNTDGTLNTIEYKYMERLNDGEYGKEFTIDDYELVVVKLGIKIKNTQNLVNDIFTYEPLTSEGFIYMDDGKLYRNSSVFYHYYLDTTFTYPIYHSFKDKVFTPENVYPSTFTLQPLEEVEGEIIYIWGKQDLENIYLSVNPNNCNIENFNGVYISFLPVSNLMDLPTE